MDSIKKEEMGKSAVKAGLWYTIGNIALKGCAFLTLPVLRGFYLQVILVYIMPTLRTSRFLLQS